MNDKVISLAVKLGISLNEVETLEDIENLLSQARQELELIEDKSSKAFKELDAVVTKAEQSLRGATNATKELGSSTDKLGKGLDAAGKSAEKLSDEQVKIQQSAGLAGATLVTFGQGLTDIRYGFGAIANNISQLTSLFFTLVGQTGSLRLAFQALKASFMGPLGILVLFQGAIALIDTFTASKKKAKKETEDLTTSISAEVVTMQTLGAVINDQNVSQDVRLKALNELKKILPELKGLELGHSGAIDIVNASIERNIELSILRGRQSKYLDTLVEKENQLADLVEQRNKANAEAKPVVVNTYDPELRWAGGGMRQVTPIIEETEEEKELTADIVKLREKLLKIKLEELGLTPPESAKTANTTKSKSETVTDLGAVGLDDDDATELEDKVDYEIELLIKQQQTELEIYLQRLEDGEIFNKEYEKALDQRVKANEEASARQIAIEKAAMLQRKILQEQGAISIIQLARLLTTGLKEENKKQFEANKKFAIAETLVSTYFSAQKAYQSQMELSTPDAPIRAAVAAGVAITQGLLRVQAIRNQSFDSATGSSATSFGADSPLTPRELVTPEIDLEQGRNLKVFVTETDIRDATSTVDTITKRATVTE